MKPDDLTSVYYNEYVYKYQEFNYHFDFMLSVGKKLYEE